MNFHKLVFRFFATQTSVFVYVKHRVIRHIKLVISVTHTQNHTHTNTPLPLTFSLRKTFLATTTTRSSQAGKQ